MIEYGLFLEVPLDLIWCVWSSNIIGPLFRSVLLPTPLPYTRLCQAIQYLTGWEVGQVRVPPGVHARQLVEPQGPLLACRADGADFEAARPTKLKDHVLWTRRDKIAVRMPIYAWLPDLRQPILTWVPAGSVWDPSCLTFLGAFAHSFPGRWTPVIWSPSNIPQLIRVAESPGRVAVLAEDANTLRCISVDEISSRGSLSSALRTTGNHIRVLGTADCTVHAPIVMRNGDVVQDTIELEGARSPWRSLWSSSSRGVRGLAPFLCLFLRFPGAVCAASLLGLGASPAYGMLAIQDQEPLRRSRSPPTRVGRRAESPRLGCWRHDCEQPALEVSSRGRCHYSVLCPFRGRGQPAHFVRDVTRSSLMHVLRGEAGPWVADFIVLGGDDAASPATLLPAAAGSFATVVVQTADTTRATVLPAYGSFRHLGACVRRLVQGWGLTITPPPALRQLARSPDAIARLRRGDTFELYTDMCHPQYRGRPIRRVVDLASLPHMNIWHLNFQVQVGGWVEVWEPHVSLVRQRVLKHIPGGSFWSPVNLGFSDGRSLPGRALDSSTALATSPGCFRAAVPTRGSPCSPPTARSLGVDRVS